jgi:hypothetical protein
MSNFRYVRKEYVDIRTITKLAIQHLDWRDYKEETLPRYENIKLCFIHFIFISPTLLTLRNDQLTSKHCYKILLNSPLFYLGC